MWNRTIKIPLGSTVTQDDEGYPIRESTYLTGIPASVLSAGRQDQILADQKGYNADAVYVVLARNLYRLPGNWSQFIDEVTGDVFEVKRIYQADKSRMVELTGQLVRRGETT